MMALLTPRRWFLSVLPSLGAVALVVLGAALVSPRQLRAERADVHGPTAAEVVGTLLGRDLGFYDVIWRARMPEIFLALTVGAALALAGALLQSLLRNPLADPFVLGVSSGAALLSVLGLTVGLSFQGGGHPLAGALGAILAAGMVWALARDGEGRLSANRMILAGVVGSYLFSAGIMWIVSLSTAAETRRYLFWLMGAVDTASAHSVLLMCGVLVLALPLCLVILPALNLLSFSEAHAVGSGVSVERVKLVTFLLAAVLTGASVSVAGSIGFVGLVVPHAVRLCFGSDLRLVAPLSALGGGAFLVVVDALCRALGSVPVGVVTASCGAPFFLWLLARSKE